MNQQIQQRQILAQMGIDWWVKTESPTQEIAEIRQEAVENAQTALPVVKDDLTTSMSKPVAQLNNLNRLNKLNTQADAEQNNAIRQAEASRPVVSDSLADSSIDSSSQPASLSESGSLESKTNNKTSVAVISESIDRGLETAEATAHEIVVAGSTADAIPEAMPKVIQETVLKTVLETAPEAVLEKTVAEVATGQAVIRPFQLQAIHYDGWVLLVDAEFLQMDNQQQQLWQNIQQALDKSVDVLKFPLVTDTQLIAMSSEPMDTVELANAALAGFVFKMVKTEQVKLAGLTELSEGLDDERLVRLPLLSEMLVEPMLKQKFWQFLND